MRLRCTKDGIEGLTKGQIYVGQIIFVRLPLFYCYTDKDEWVFCEMGYFEPLLD